MNRPGRILLAVLLTLILVFSGLRPALADTRSDYEAYCDAQFRRAHVQSGVVLVSVNGERAAAFTFGPRTQQGGEITPDTCYRVASVTKFVTAVGLMTLYEQGAFQLDADIREALPMMPIANPAFPDTPVTARQLLSHTSSFVTDVEYYKPTWELITNPENKYYEKKYAPGTHYAYSNMNGAIFGSMIEALSGKSLNTYMQEAVFDPLGINAAYHPALLRDQSDIGDIFGMDGHMQILYMSEIRRLENYMDTCDPRGNCGYSVARMYISAAGLERLLLTLMNGGAWDGVRLLQPETVAMMEAEQEKLPGSSVSAPSRYGLGMEHLPGRAGGTWYGHQGRVGSFTCDAYYQKDTGLTVVVIATGYRYSVQDGMVFLAIKLMDEAQKFVAAQ